MPQKFNSYKKIVISLTLCLLTEAYSAQILTKEDSLNAGLVANNQNTVISSYGSFAYKNNLTLNEASINVERFVLFFGHRFTNKIYFFSEVEIEDAKIVGGEASGEISLEQAFVKFNLSPSAYLTGGLFIPRIGIINENHLPTTYNGNRPMVEQLIIPSTWRELGIGFYKNSNKIAGLNYSLAVVNGLSSRKFEAGSGIREGRFEGSNASASALAVTGSVLHYGGNFRTQISGYYGGTAGLTKREADSLQLESGFFGTPLALGEINSQYTGNRFFAKVLFTYVAIPQAEKINTAFGNNTPESMLGTYVEIGYDVFKKETKTLKAFTRIEFLDMNYTVPENGIRNSASQQSYWTTGFSFLPVNGVIAKLDYTYQMTGSQNPALIVTPFPQALPYQQQQHSIHLSLGYSF